MTGQTISGFGIEIRLIATTTYPLGITITQLADDTDPFNLPDVTIGESSMGVNGDPLFWSKATIIQWGLSVAPNTEDDQNLQLLWDVNSVGKGKASVDDQILITATYPDGRTVTLSNGKMLSGPSGDTVQSSGRLKTKTYNFGFGKIVRTY